MARTIKEVTPQLPVQSIAIRVAAYARVSSGKDAMLHSLSAQVSYYSQYIQNHPGWIYCGVYSDEAFTGTKENREGFQELLKECRAGNIDLIITKSISRFARNTVTLLETVRELKQLGVDVYFEEQNIHTLSADGELMLTILASYAQEESRSASENQKWRIRKTFEEGKPWRGRMLGYRLVDGTYQVIPKEAEVVRWIYQEYLSGKGYITLAKELNESGRFTRDGNPWAVFTVRKILHNYSYTGNLLLQTTYRENHITKKTLRNKGQYPMFHVVGAHEPIVSLEDFEKVQRLADSKADHFKCNGEKGAYPFTGKHKHRIDAGVDTAGNVCIEPIAHHHRLFRRKTGALQRQIHHLRLRLTHHLGSPSRGAIEHLAHTAAIRHTAIPCRAYPVGIGGHKLHTPLQQNAGILQFLECQFRVKSA